MKFAGLKMFYVTNDTVHANHHSSSYIAIIPPVV